MRVPLGSGLARTTGMPRQSSGHHPIERIASRVGIALLGAIATAISGAACPVCVVAAPALIGVGAYRRWRAACQRSSCTIPGWARALHQAEPCDSRVKALVLGHIPPNVDAKQADVLASVRSSFAGDVRFATDCMRVGVGGER